MLIIFLTVFQKLKATMNSTSSHHEEVEQQQDEEPRVVESFAVNLNEEAEKGNIDPLIGRDDELERTLQVLKPSP